MLIMHSMIGESGKSREKRTSEGRGEGKRVSSKREGFSDGEEERGKRELGGNAK